MRQGEELSESLLNTNEDDGTNNGRAEVNSTNTAHTLLQRKEEANVAKPKLKSLKERLAEAEAESAQLKEKLKKRG